MVWPFDGEEGVRAFLALGGDVGVAGGGAGATGIRLSDGESEKAFTIVTKCARSVVTGLEAVPRMRTSPPRSSA